MVRQNVAMVTLGLVAASCHTITEELPQPRSHRRRDGARAHSRHRRSRARGHADAAAGRDADARSRTPALRRRLRPPSAGSCNLGNGNGSGNGCPLERAWFQEVVERAIDNVIRNNPSLFDKSKDRCVQGCPFVRNTDGYWDAVTDEVRRLGYCATNDGEELAVKNSNSFNDQYDIINAEGFVRRGTGAYRATCYPAWF